MLFAENQKAREEKEYKDMPPGNGLPEELLHQAIVFSLSGWGLKEIGEVIGRSPDTIKYWKRTKAWKMKRDELLIDRVQMYLVNHHLTLRQLLRESVSRHVGD